MSFYILFFEISLSVSRVPPVYRAYSSSSPPTWSSPAGIWLKSLNLACLTFACGGRNVGGGSALNTLLETSFSCGNLKSLAPPTDEFTHIKKHTRKKQIMHTDRFTVLSRSLWNMRGGCVGWVRVRWASSGWWSCCGCAWQTHALFIGPLVTDASST